MKLIEYLLDKDEYEFADRLLVTKAYLHSISVGNARPSKRLAKLIEIQSGGEVTSAELFLNPHPLRKKCPECGQYMKRRKNEV